MCGGERIRDLNGNLQRMVERERTFLQPLLQRLAIQVLHYQEVDSVLTTDVVDVANVRVTQGRERLCFALEALFQFGIGGDVLWKNLDGNGSV